MGACPLGGTEESGAPKRLNDLRSNVGTWLSLVEHPFRDRKVAGSNPVAPTNFRREKVAVC
jgi:hypothetical protein